MAPEPRDPETRAVELREQRAVVVATGPATIPDGPLQKVGTVADLRHAGGDAPPVERWISHGFTGITCSGLDNKLPPPCKGSAGFDKFFKKKIRR